MHRKGGSVSEQRVIGIYDSLSKAEEAVYKLNQGEFPIKQASIVAQHLQSERRVNGYVIAAMRAKRVSWPAPG